MSSVANIQSGETLAPDEVRLNGERIGYEGYRIWD